MYKAWIAFAQLVAALALVLAALFGLGSIFPNLLPNILQSLTPDSSQATPPKASSFAEAAAVSRPSVVNIFTSHNIHNSSAPFSDAARLQQFFGDQNPSSNLTQRASNLGSGVIVSTDGYILTNHHVIEAADEIQVALSTGAILNAKIVGTDPDTDLAVLKVNHQPLTSMAIAKPESLRVGDVVLAIGNPFGVGQTVTMGIVSALGRNHLGINTFENYIQTDAAINPGNSGGALVDSAGNLVGINTAIFSRSGVNLGIGFAIPISIVQQVMGQIIERGEVVRGWVGIEVQEMTRERADSFGLRSAQGALIAGVLRKGPADKAGIVPGDVLVAVDSKPVSNSSSLLGLIAALPPGKIVQLDLVRTQNRTQKPMRIAVTIEKRPSPTRQKP